MKKGRHENVEMPEYLSPECQDFLSLIFIKKKHRIKINEFIKHKWYETMQKKLNYLSINHYLLKQIDPSPNKCILTELKNE